MLVVLNTSLDENEPIVCTLEDVLNCSLRTQMEAQAAKARSSVSNAQMACSTRATASSASSRGEGGRRICGWVTTRTNWPRQNTGITHVVDPWASSVRRWSP